MPDGAYPPIRGESAIQTRLGQCLLLVQTNLLELRSSTVWIHNVFLRSNALDLAIDGVFSMPYGMLAVTHGNLYLSSVTFQGQVDTKNGSVLRNEIPLLAAKTMPVSMGTTQDNDTLAKVLMTGVWPSSAIRCSYVMCQYQCHFAPLMQRSVNVAVAAPCMCMPRVHREYIGWNVSCKGAPPHTQMRQNAHQASVRADCIISSQPFTQLVQYGTVSFVRTIFGKSYTPAVKIIGPKGAVKLYNVTFRFVDVPPGTTDPQDESLVADPLQTNKVFGDALAMANISIPIKPTSAAPADLFLQNSDPEFLALQRVRILFHSVAQRLSLAADLQLTLHACFRLEPSKHVAGALHVSIVFVHAQCFRQTSC